MMRKKRRNLPQKLIDVYTEYNKYYPKSEATVKKAMLLYQNKLASDEEVYALLDTAFTNNNEFFTDYNAIETYFVLYVNKYKEGKENISADSFVEKYGAVSAQARKAAESIKQQMQALLKKQEADPLTNNEKLLLINYETAVETLGAVGENIDGLASKHLSCKKLEDYYTKEFEANASNTSWLEAMVNTMLNNRCSNAAILEQGAVALHKLQPTTESAFNLGAVYQKKNDIKKAVAYFEESAQLETNQKKKADLYYRIASVFRGSDRAAAKKYALMAAQHNPTAGRPYILLAELYSSASKECGLTPFEQKALLWLAIDTVKKAEAAEAKYKPTVASMIKSYTERLPSKEEIKGAGKRKGDKITYGCWINETVTIPNLK
jgi:hypothetical protein